MSPTGHGLRYAPGLDGVRALAVLAVVAYHFGTTGNHTLLVGGYLGVDVFFVLSGYLITSLLVVEAERSGRISIKNFYLRRARRLLPALFAMLVVVAAAGAYWLPQQAARLRGDLLASVFYYQNWWLIAQSSSYFGTGGDRPPMLTHLWSLAVEEQYYLVWPLVLILFAAVRARRAVALLLVGAAVLASTGLGLVLFDPYTDPSRVYYGTDTRALAPLLGALLAIAVRPWLHRTRLPGRATAGLDLIGLVGLAGLAVIAAGLPDTDERLYRGGFLVIALFAAALVAVAGHPATMLGRILGAQPLRYLGERSYAIYLWHWPVCLVTRPDVDIPVTGWANSALRLGIAIGLAEISYHLIEKPIRRNGFLAPLRTRARTVSPAAGSSATPVPGADLTGSAGGYRAMGRAVVGRPAAAAAATSRQPPSLQPSSRQPPSRRSGLAVARTLLLSALLAAAGTWAGFGLNAAASQPIAGGPVDPGADQSLGPLPTTSPATVEPTPTATGPVRPALTPGATVAFFGDSQAMTLLLNKPADLDSYINAKDDTIEGCGIQLGRMESRSGERRNMTGDCANWRSIWIDRVNRDRPDVAVIMIGAWDVFDVTLDDGTKLAFGTPEWDQNFRSALAQAVHALVAPGRFVAISLLPCFRPISASAGYWPERGDDDRTRHVNDLLRGAVAWYPGQVLTLDPPAEFCTDPAIATNTAYRWDGVHYYKKGAALYFSAMLPQLMAS